MVSRKQAIIGFLAGGAMLLATSPAFAELKVIGSGRTANDPITIVDTKTGLDINGNKVPAAMMQQYGLTEPPLEVIEVPAEPLNLNGTYNFDINGDGQPDTLSIVEGKVKTDLGNGNIQYVPIDTARWNILEAVRFANEDSKLNRQTAKGYLLAFNPLDVLGFMYATNELATNIPTDRKQYYNQTKFTRPITWSSFVDKLANLNVRGNYLIKTMSESKGQSLTVINNEKGRLAYANTFGEEVPAGEIFARWVLGSSIYDTFKKDFRPTITANSALAMSRGAELAQTTRKLETELSTSSLSQAFSDTKDMYEAQIWAATQQVGGYKK